MIRLDDWTIIKIDDNESYIIGVSEEGRTIHTTTIYKLDYLHNDFVIVRTQNNTYKLYFEDQFVPTEVDRELTHWKFEKNDKYLKNINYYNVKDRGYDILGSRVVGYIDDYKHWETTPIVRIIHYTNYLHVYTESGSDYVLYWSDKASILDLSRFDIEMKEILT